jgi:uncharacterized protein (TIGR03083 family)
MTTPADRAVRAARSIEKTGKAQADQLRAAEIAAWIDLLASLGHDDWSRPTVCTLWDVRDVVGHVCGHAEEVLRPWLFALRERRAGRRHPTMSKIDGHMQVQVDEHRELPPAQVRERFARLWPRANRRLRRTPNLIRRLQLPTDVPDSPKIGVAYLHDVIYLRDLWMHRDDICEASGKPFAIGSHDGAVVEQVLRDLDQQWSGPAVFLELTGSVKGVWQLGAGEPAATVRIDAVNYMRTLAGRHDAPAADVVCSTDRRRRVA